MNTSLSHPRIQAFKACDVTVIGGRLTEHIEIWMYDTIDRLWQIPSIGIIGNHLNESVLSRGTLKAYHGLTQIPQDKPIELRPEFIKMLEDKMWVFISPLTAKNDCPGLDILDMYLPIQDVPVLINPVEVADEPINTTHVEADE